jgi:hypothetical protein
VDDDRSSCQVCLSVSQAAVELDLTHRLGISCGLHQIPSSVWKPCVLPRDRTADLIALVRQRTFVIPPPADPVELGERIGAL